MADTLGNSLPDALVRLTDLIIATDDEGTIDAGALQPGDHVGEVRPVPDHPRRDMRHRPKTMRLELLTQRDGCLDALGG